MCANGFGDDNLSIYFGEDKTKCILFSKGKNLSEFNITYNNNKINIVKYLLCYLDANLNGESMTMKLLKKISAKLQFFYEQDEFLNQRLHRFLFNSLIQPHFDYDVFPVSFS